MKKTICKALVFILCAALLLPASVCAVMAEDNGELSVYVASDIHYRPQSSLTPLSEQNSFPDSTLYYHTNTKSMLTYEADAVIDEFLSRFEASDAEILLIPGDISENGQWDEHLGIAAKLNEFELRTGKRVFVIPGNHDIRTSASGGRLDLSDFLEVYANLGYDEAISRHASSASYTAELNYKYRLLAIDACIYREDGSSVSDDLYSWIEAQVAAAKQDGKELVGMVHHNLLKHFGIESIAGGMLCLDNNKDLATQFADWGVKYFFTGHEHANDISSAVSKNGNTVYDIETGCLLAYPNAYREVSFTDAAVEIKTGYIDKIDSSLLPDGYNAEQLSLIESDFTAYSYGYFRAGLRSVAYDINDSTAKIAKKLKIEEGTKEYNALSAAMNRLGEALRLPLYDTLSTPESDSVEEIAAENGIEIEKSDYADVIDVAAVIYAGHYAGDENTAFDSLEVRLLGQGLKAAIVYALMNIPTDTANILFSGLKLNNNGFTLTGTFCGLSAKLLYVKTAASIIFVQYIRPLANGIINDISDPGDLNVTLEAYGQNDTSAQKTVAITTWSSFVHLLKVYFETIKNIFTALFSMR